MTAARTVGKEKGGSVRTLEVAGMAVALTRDQTLKLRGYLD